ncbi:MAG: 7-carboxy-7-deazaguanine synthase QueE [Phycisphaerae bacterium]
MLISEVFYSIQGEGMLTGTPSVFVRTSGCNLRCIWCDTPYTSWNPEGTERSVAHIVDDVAVFGARHVVVTGGEPTIAPEIANLCTALRDEGHHVTLETAATVLKPIPCDLASISPKLANSTPPAPDGGAWAQRHESRRINLDAIRHYLHAPDYQLKFVVQREADLNEINALLAQIETFDRHRVFLMPEGVTESALNERATWMVEACKRRGFRFCPRLQIHLFGNRRGT